MGEVGMNQQEGPPMKRNDCTVGDYLLPPTERRQPAPALCFCNALRQASRAVSRLYDEELRGVGLRTTQYSLLRQLSRSGEVRQRDLGGLASLDETTLASLDERGWVAVRPGQDRREKRFKITAAGVAKLEEARPAWERAQARMQALLLEGTWQGLLAILPEVVRLTAGA
jgi:DNA-binding MarR family transcriptional regulator